MIIDYNVSLNYDNCDWLSIPMIDIKRLEFSNLTLCVFSHGYLDLNTPTMSIQQSVYVVRIYIVGQSQY